MATAQPKSLPQTQPALIASRLADALAVHRGVLDRRTTLPILECVRLRAGSGKLEVAGTDLDTLVEFTMAYDGPAFSTCVRLEALVEAMAAFGDAPVSIYSTPQHLRLSSPDDASVFVIAALPPEDFRMPVAPTEPGICLNLNRSVVEDALKTVRPAISREETRYYLMGIYMTPVDGQLEWVATDGHRLHQARTPLDGNPDALPSPIIQTKAGRAILAALGVTDDVLVTFEFWPRRASVTIGDWRIITTPIDGTFPDYRRVIPTDIKGEMAFAAADMGRILRAIVRLPMGNERNRLRLEPRAGRIAAASSEGVCYENTIAGKVSGEVPEAIGVNAAFLLDILNARPDRQARLKFTGDDEAMPFLVDFDDDPTFRAVLMPMRAPTA